MLVLGLIFHFSSGGSGLGYGADEESRVVFINEDVHRNINNDFAIGVLPVYDGPYCIKKFSEVYGGSTQECTISGVESFSTVNPLIVSVTCSCLS
jgi:hypothetical protein